MAKTRKTPIVTPRSVSPERALRLHRLLQLLGAGPQTRAMIKRRLKLDVRGFYRDLELLRDAGIRIELQKQRYQLEDDLRDAVGFLPFPDPGLTLGEAQQLARGRTAAHRKLKQQISQILA